MARVRQQGEVQERENSVNWEKGFRKRIFAITAGAHCNLLHSYEEYLKSIYQQTDRHWSGNWYEVLTANLAIQEHLPI